MKCFVSGFSILVDKDSTNYITSVIGKVICKSINIFRVHVIPNVLFTYFPCTYSPIPDDGRQRLTPNITGAHNTTFSYRAQAFTTLWTQLSSIPNYYL